MAHILMVIVMIMEPSENVMRPHVSMQEFSSLESCKAAGETAYQIMGKPRQVYTRCVPK